MPALVCQNRGCGREFEPASADDCVFHPGAPVFHEGLKARPPALLARPVPSAPLLTPPARAQGWSCCSKRVTDFDAFLKIPGCAVGKHTTQTPESPAPAAPASEPPKASAVAADGVETFHVAGPALSAPAAASAAAPASAPSTAPAPPVVAEQDLNDAADAQIAEGAVCRRKACGQRFAATAARGGAECVFHPGAPIFHEGSKGWSCCTRRVLEFDEFLKIKGCTTGRHRFTDVAGAAGAAGAASTPASGADAAPAAAPASGPAVVECRRDWYQTPDKVILSVFAKKVDKARTAVAFTDTSLHVDVVFLDGSVSRYHTQLFQPIVAADSRFEILSTKIEMTLCKANGLSWVAIEPKDNVTSWTTFGISGSVGTIGGKEAAVAKDAPLHLLQK
ncbi:hypothetical protein HK105_200742 [Polyrhizophydium stewartii]|uniref:Chord-domain-containing protein n=1 Tax=Polyrhizophydium stewartii TaxID=2732419 RepID=A0ABR4NJX1_9FUNG|nr:hypothetical protein HK105_002643 [Polyrhizophydium stewartii]